MGACGCDDVEWGISKCSGFLWAGWLVQLGLVSVFVQALCWCMGSVVCGVLQWEVRG